MKPIIIYNNRVWFYVFENSRVQGIKKQFYQFNLQDDPETKTVRGEIL